MPDTAAPAAEGTASAPALYPPRVLPPTGRLPVWKFIPTFLANPLRTLHARVYNEPIFAPPGMRGRVAWVTAPDLVERVLLGEHETFPKSPIERRIFSSVLGDGILTAEGQSWRWQRRTVAPLFRHQEIMALLPAMARVAGDMVARWQTCEAGTTRRIDQDMTDVTFSLLAATIFAGATADEEATLKQHIGAYLGHTSWDVALETLGVPAWIWHPSKPAMARHARRLRATISKLLDRERAAGFPGGGLLAKLGSAHDPQTGEPMSDGLISNNLLTFAAAGHETTAKALTWSLYLLARAPQWQQRIRAEVRQVASDGPLEARHLDQLPVTRRVLQEAMRLYPPAPVLGRMTTVPVELGGHHFKPGAILILPIWAIHRHHQLWVDPERFDPDRFLPEREAAMKRTQYMPFGFGPRTCIGMGFAMMEGMSLLATFVRATHFGCADDLAPEPVSRVTLRAKGGVPLTVAPA